MRPQIVPGVSSVIAICVILLPHPARTAEPRYDLGGPCADQSTMHIREINDAKKNGQWDRVVDLTKQDVRAGCTVEYRWETLANTLLEAGRPAEALQVLNEMDARNFDLNPSFIHGQYPEVAKLMESAAFLGSSLGAKLEALKKISEERRVIFRDKLAKLRATQRPPENYVAKGACPFECCRYGNWKAREDVDLVAAPGSTRVIGNVKKGTPVTGVTGEVHVQPEPVGIVADTPIDGVALPKGAIAFVLDYEGEGYGHVYTDGKLVSIFLGYNDYCFRVSELCWAEKIFPGSIRKKAVWWVKVKLAGGLTGWTDKADRFDGQDGCG